MAKLPPEFVKAPATPAPPAKAKAKAKARGKTTSDDKTEAPGKRRAPRRKKASLLDTPATAAELARQIRLELSDDEMRALDTARQEIRRAGEPEVTLEQMIHRALGEWIAGRRAIGRRVAESGAASGQPATQGVRRGSRAQIEWVVARLRRLAADPLAGWRELTDSLRRLAGARAQAR